MNAVRSPMAEGIMKKLYGSRVYVQSAGVRHAQEVDGFSIAVCQEIGVDLTGHKVRSFDELDEWAEVESFDLIIALSPAAQRRALEYTRHLAIEVDYWPTLDPANLGESREEGLAAYRQTRDQIYGGIVRRFGAAIAAPD
jgi:arsenate reductase